MDDAELLVNIGILLVSAIAAAVAWWQAAQARRSREDAQTASSEASESRRLAVAAQQDAARALTEANDIARSAQAAVDDQLALERRRELRLTEHRDVNWGGGWDTEVGADTPPTLELTNIGTTDAINVTLTMDLPQGRQSYFLGDVAAGGSGRAETRDTEMRGPAAAAVMARRDISIEVHWSSPMGYPDSKPGVIWGE